MLRISGPVGGSDGLQFVGFSHKLRDQWLHWPVRASQRAAAPHRAELPLSVLGGPGQWPNLPRGFEAGVYRCLRIGRTLWLPGAVAETFVIRNVRHLYKVAVATVGRPKA